MKNNIAIKTCLFIAGIHFFILNIVIPCLINENTYDVINGVKLSTENVNYVIKTSRTMSLVICVLCLKTFFEILIKRKELDEGKKKKHKNSNVKIQCTKNNKGIGISNISLSMAYSKPIIISTRKRCKNISSNFSFLSIINSPFFFVLL